MRQAKSDRTALVTARKALVAVRTEHEEAMREAVRDALKPLPHYSRYCATSRERLEQNDPVFRYLADEFQRTARRHRPPAAGAIGPAAYHCLKPKFEVDRIERVHTPRLQLKYLAELNDIIGLCEQHVTPIFPPVDALAVRTHPGINLNEFHLYHGAPSDLAERLMKQGLDERRGGEHFGKLFGRGVYFASNSSKSDIYTEPSTDDGCRCVFVMRVCLGEAYLTEEPMGESQRPPERMDDRGPLNSVVALTWEEGGCVEYPECIVYNGRQALPEFAIWYRHADNCWCTHCHPEGHAAGPPSPLTIPVPDDTVSSPSVVLSSSSGDDDDDNDDDDAY